MDSFDSLATLGDTLPAMPGHPSLPISKPGIDARLEKVYADHPDDEAAHIEVVAEINGWFRGESDAVLIVDAYMDGIIDIQEAVHQIAEPVERAYAIANGGRLLISQEEVTRSEQTIHSSEEDGTTDPPDTMSVEGELWDLYFTILHAAKKIPWSDSGAQQKLVDLLTAIKARSNPQRPAKVKMTMDTCMVYAPRGLWGDLAMLGIASREVWNDQPGCHAGWEAPVVSAWVNVNAFLARFTVQEVSNFGSYGNWALHNALPVELKGRAHRHCRTTLPVHEAEFWFKVAAVWIRLAGRYIYDHFERDPEVADPEDEVEPLWPRSEWDRWRMRFEDKMRKAQYSDEVTSMSRECAVLMAACSETDGAN